MKIAERLELINRIRDEHYVGRCCESNAEFAVDLLADLMHWCEHAQVNLEDAMASASIHFDAEG